MVAKYLFCIFSLTFFWRGTHKWPRPAPRPEITLAARGLEEPSLIFVIIVSFMLFTVFPLVYVLYFEEFLIHDSRGFMILKNN